MTASIRTTAIRKKANGMNITAILVHYSDSQILTG
jgi:hypothetical protein